MIIPMVNIETNGKINENDIAVFKNNKWQIVSQAEYFSDLIKVMSEMEQKIQTLEEKLGDKEKEIEEYKHKTNLTLYKHRLILKRLIKEK